MDYKFNLKNIYSGHILIKMKSIFKLTLKMNIQYNIFSKVTSLHYFGQCYDFMKLIRFNKVIIDVEFINI